MTMRKSTTISRLQNFIPADPFGESLQLIFMGKNENKIIVIFIQLVLNKSIERNRLNSKILTSV